MPILKPGLIQKTNLKNIFSLKKKDYMSKFHYLQLQ